MARLTEGTTPEAARRPKRNGSGLTRFLGWGVVAASGVTIVSLLALHALRADLDPIRRALSEYANGPHGALMAATHLSQSVASLALAAGVVSARPVPRPVRLGIALVVVSASAWSSGSSCCGIWSSPTR